MIHNYNLEEMNKTGVYKITCNTNKRFYIGSASSYIGYKIGFKTRLNHHITRLNANKHRNPILQNSWNKYGSNDFKFEIVEFCEPINCKEREQYYIDTLQPFYPNGFNICKNALINNKPVMYKNRTSTRDISNLNSNLRKPLLQKTLAGEFIAEHLGATEAFKTTGIQRGGIYKCCIGEAKHAGGFKWEYKFPEHLQKRPCTRSPITIKDITNNTTTIYKSYIEASKHLDYCKSTIHIYSNTNQLLGNRYMITK